MARKRTTELARRLRAEPTDAETKLWLALRAGRLGGPKFVRQFPIGWYVADFACRSAKLVVELDGGQHAGQVARDAARTEAIELFGYSVIRFWNNEVFENMDGVLEQISRELANARGRSAPFG